MEKRTIRLVYCYTDKDEDMAGRLLPHLQQMAGEGLISLANTQSLIAGSNVQETLENLLDEAQIILLLLSVTFFGSDIHKTAMQRAKERHEREGVRVIPIILKPYEWEAEEWIGKLQVLPTDPLLNSDWTDFIYLNVAQGVRRVVLELQIREIVEEGKRQYAAKKLAVALTTYTTALARYQTLQLPCGDLSLLEDIHQGIRVVQEVQVREMVEEGKKQYAAKNFETAQTTYDAALDLYKLQELYADQSLLDKIYWGMGDTFFARNERDRAWENYEQALHNSLKEDGKKLAKGEKLKALGWECEKRKRHEQALAAYEQAIEEDPGNATFHFAKGRVLLAFKGDLKGALEAYAQAAKLDSRFAPQPVSSKGVGGEKLLSECIVQIIFNEDIKGAGFFIAPGVILTVVPAPFSHFSEVTGSNLKIIWQGENLDILNILPKRDLALCYISQLERVYPYLPLSGDIQSFDSTYCYTPSYPSGFSSLTVLGFEGERETERIILDAANDVRDNMSGAPLVHSQTRSVCGIMTQSHMGALQAENAIHMRTVIEMFKDLAFLHKNMQKETELSQNTSDRTTSIVIAYASEDAGLFAQLLQEIQKQQTDFKNLRLYWNSLLVPDLPADQRVRCVEEAQFFLFLISPAFFASDNLWKSYILRALDRQQGRNAEIIPIFLRLPDSAFNPDPETALRMAKFDALQELPKNGQPVTAWQKPEQAFEEIVRGIAEVLQLPEKPSDLYLEARYTKACRIFYSYADEDAEWFLRFQTELKMQGQVLSWHRYQVIAGSDRKYEIHRHLEAAQIVLIYRSLYYEKSPINELEGKYAYAIQQRRKKNLQIIDIPFGSTYSGNTGPLPGPDILKGPIKESKKDFADALKRANAPTPKQIWQKILLLILALLVAFALVAGGAWVQSILPPGASILPPSAIASVSFAPQTQQIIQPTNSFSASFDVSQVDISTQTIPAHYSTYSDIEISQPMPTTGEVNCFLGAFPCQQGVSQDDVDTLTKQTEQQLTSTINWNLQEQIENLNGMQSGPISFFILNTSSNPSVNQPGQTVTVTVLEAGKAEYVLTTDVAKLVHQLLLAQIPAGYQIIEQTFSLGQLVTGNDGSLSISAGAVACYQFSQARLDSIHTALEGKSVAAAETFLKNQPEVDPGSIQIHFTSGRGNYLPDDFQHIKLSFQCPTNLPAVSLPTVA
jgi:tetratricopeptide (TPR) repeat protein